MQTTSYQEDHDSVTTLSRLERYDAAEGRSSEATWLPVSWRSPQSWPLPLGPKARARAVSAPSKNKPRPINAGSDVAFDDALAGDLDEGPVCVHVEKAKNLLLNPHYYFSEIATELGFESLGQFNQAFKRLVGESPQAYRARLPTRNASKVEMD